MTKIRLINATVVSMNDADDVIDNAVVEIENGIISFVGRRLEFLHRQEQKVRESILLKAHSQAASATSAKSKDIGQEENQSLSEAVEQGIKEEESCVEIIDCAGDVVMPAFINTHSHLSMTGFRGVADDVSLNDWLYKHIFPLEKNMTAQLAYEGAMVGIREHVRAGIVGVADMYMFPKEVQKALWDSGMYGRVIDGGNDLNGRTTERLSEIEQVFLELRAEAHGRQIKDNDCLDRVRVWLGAHAEYTCTEEYLEGIAFLANKYKTPVSIHLAETLYETGACAKRHNNLSPAQYLHSLGLMEYGGIAAHCVYCDKDDIGLLKQSGMSVSLNLGSNLKLGSGIPQLGTLFNSGINLTLGTDSAASNNRLDIMREMYLAAVLTKGVQNDPRAVDAFSVLRAATHNGYRALDINGGIVTEGMDASLIRLSLDEVGTGISFMNKIDAKDHEFSQKGITNDKREQIAKNKAKIISDIVYSSISSQIRMTMCRGRILYQPPA